MERKEIFDQLSAMGFDYARAYFDGGNDSGCVMDIVLSNGDYDQELKALSRYHGPDAEKELFNGIEEFIWYELLGSYNGSPQKTGFVLFNVKQRKVFLTCARTDWDRDCGSEGWGSHDDYKEIKEKE